MWLGGSLFQLLRFNGIPLGGAGRSDSLGQVSPGPICCSNGVDRRPRERIAPLSSTKTPVPQILSFRAQVERKKAWSATVNRTESHHLGVQDASLRKQSTGHALIPVTQYRPYAVLGVAIRAYLYTKTCGLRASEIPAILTHVVISCRTRTQPMDWRCMTADGPARSELQRGTGPCRVKCPRQPIDNEILDSMSQSDLWECTH